MQNKLDFFVPGFSKCGTTSLFEVLSDHPKIYIPAIKEPNIFLKSSMHEIHRQIELLYSDVPEGSILGDCSTFYSAATCDKECAVKIFNHNPNAKLIFLARDPVLRIESSFREMHTNGPLFGLNAPYSLYDAFSELPQLIEDTMFYSRLSAFRGVFPDNNILVLFLEDLKADIKKEADRCYRFLGIDSLEYSRKSMPKKNDRNHKLYDSRLMRLMRSTPLLGALLSKIPLREQDKWAVRLHLRKRFAHEVAWTEQSEKYALSMLSQDIEKFLKENMRNRDLWPKYQSMYERHGHK